MFKFLICLSCVFCYYTLNAQIVANRFSQCEFNKDYYLVEFFIVEVKETTEISAFTKELKNKKNLLFPYYMNNGLLQLDGKEIKYSSNIFLIKKGIFLYEETTQKKEEQLNLKNSFSGELFFKNNVLCLKYKYTCGILSVEGNTDIVFDQIFFVGATLTTTKSISGADPI